MALKDKKFLLAIATLSLLASCSKTPVTEEAPITTTGDTSGAEEQLLNDINEVINTVEDESNKVPLPSSLPKPTEQTPPQAPTPAPSPVGETIESQQKVMKLNQKYQTPGGMDEAEFTVSMMGGTISSVTITTIKGGDVTKKMQGLFGDAINATVGGKTLEEAEALVAVGGASLTTKAFVTALKGM